MSESPWESTLALFQEMERVPAAVATGDLLRQAEDRWEGKVVPRTSMLDLLFTLPGEAFPWRTTVRVSHVEGVFDFQLVRDGHLVTADRAGDTNAPVVLDAFLMQLSAHAE